MLKKYWDIFGGFIISALIVFISNFQLESIQLVSSIIILILLMVGVFRVLKQSLDKYLSKKEDIREQTVLDNIIDLQKCMRAVHMSEAPLEDGEKLGKLILYLIGVIKIMFNKIKEFFDKFKGFILAIALGVLTIVEMAGGYLDTLIGGVLTVNGIELLPIITLVAALVVAALSNGFSTEQLKQIKQLFAKPVTNKTVVEEIKKTIKATDAVRAENKKKLSVAKSELVTLEKDLAKAKNTFEAKKQLAAMVPPVATAEEVNIVNREMIDLQNKVNAKAAEIANLEKLVENANTAVAALKTKLK